MLVQVATTVHGATSTLGSYPCLLLSVTVLTNSILPSEHQQYLPKRQTIITNLDKLFDDRLEAGMCSSFLYIPKESAGFTGRVPGEVPQVGSPLRSFIGHAKQNRSSSIVGGFSLLRLVQQAHASMLHSLRPLQTNKIEQ